MPPATMTVTSSIAVPMIGRRQRPMMAPTMKVTATSTAAIARIVLVGMTACTSVYRAPATRPFCESSVE